MTATIAAKYPMMASLPKTEIVMTVHVRIRMKMRSARMRFLTALRSFGNVISCFSCKKVLVWGRGSQS